MVLRIIFLFALLWPALLCAAPAVWLGVSFTENRSASGLTLAIKGVHPSSGALKAGIVSGESIVGLDGKSMNNMEALRQRLSKAKVGDQIKLSVANEQGQVREVLVELTARPDDLRNFMKSMVGTKVGALDQNIYANRGAMLAKPKARLLDFWATWCGPCRQTMPILRDMWGKYHGKGLDIIGLSSEAPGVLDAFQRQEKIPWPMVRDVNDVQASFYGVRALPTLILTDSLGYVQRIWTGVPQPAELDASIRKVMGGG